MKTGHSLCEFVHRKLTDRQRYIAIVLTIDNNRDDQEIAVTYFRAGYAPEDYPTPKVKEEARGHGVMRAILTTRFYMPGMEGKARNRALAIY